MPSFSAIHLKIESTKAIKSSLYHFPPHYFEKTRKTWHWECGLLPQQTLSSSPLLLPNPISFQLSPSPDASPQVKPSSSFYTICVLNCSCLKILSGCFGLKVLEGLKYANSHEWVKHEGSVATIGISDHAQVTKTELIWPSLDQIRLKEREIM